MLEEINDHTPDKVTRVCDGASFQSLPFTLTCVETGLCAHHRAHLHGINACKNMDESTRGCVSESGCVCECVTASPTHYNRTYPRVAFTSDLCSAAGTITERPDSSVSVHHIHSLSSALFFLTASFSPLQPHQWR